MKRWKPIQWLMGVAAGICSGCYRAGRRDAHDGGWTRLTVVGEESVRGELRISSGQLVCSRGARRGPLVSAQDHGVDHVDASGKCGP
jgi:hypothetical protein